MHEEIKTKVERKANTNPTLQAVEDRPPQRDYEDYEIIHLQSPVWKPSPSINFNWIYQQHLTKNQDQRKANSKRGRDQLRGNKIPPGQYHCWLRATGFLQYPPAGAFSLSIPKKNRKKKYRLNVKENETVRRTSHQPTATSIYSPASTSGEGCKRKIMQILSKWYPSCLWGPQAGITYQSSDYFWIYSSS